MEKLIGSTPAGMGLATTAVLVVLLERLISTGALTRAEVADILREARNDLEPYKSISSVADAVGVVGKLAARLRQNPAPLRSLSYKQCTIRTRVFLCSGRPVDSRSAFSLNKRCEIALRTSHTRSLQL